MATFLEALGKAVSSLEEEITKEALKRLELSAAKLAEAIEDEYREFFEHLQRNIVGSGIPGFDPGLPTIFGSLGMQPWTKLTDNWMDKKNRAFDRGDNDALDFYRGISNTSRKKKKSLYKYVGELAETPGAEKKFFGGTGLTFTITQPDGRRATVSSSTQIKHHLELIQTSRDVRGRFTKFMQGTTLTAHITAFPKIAPVMADRGIPDAALANYMGSQDSANKNQWHKFRGQIGAHRPALIPLIQWYLDVKFKQLTRQYIF